MRKEPFDPANNWRFRYHAVFLTLGCMVPAFDISLAVFMGFYDLGTPSYVYLTALAVSLVEGLYIAIAVTLIELHKFTHSHWDMGKALLPLWCGSLTINLAYFIGGSSSDSTDSTFEIGAIIGGLSQLCGLILIVMSFLLHILLLTDPDPKAHGFHPKHRYHKFRRHRHPDDTTDSGDGSEGGGDDGGLDDEDDEKERR
ncbi:hypothetical protein JCM5296_003129 [Sporobolomyces johnsonii]